jgi:demethylmenaquinone methyltransferase/2-methoxy-6-polyprenyl-1,4-benzoquinol methylase
VLAVSIDPRAVASFFDERAATWDERRKADPEKLRMILDYADIRRGHRVADIGCGTGVLFPQYLERGVARVTGVDISAAMLAVAREKHRDERIELVVADVESAVFDHHFDRVVVFDALPHFPSPRRLAARLAAATAGGGRLTIAHDIGRQRLNAVHDRLAGSISVALVCERTLAEILDPYFDVDIARSEEHLYVVSGVRRTERA